MSILHTINKSPFTHTTIFSCLAICNQDDGILFVEDGVFGAMNSAPCAQQLSICVQNGLNIYALSDDINARGLQDKINPNVKLTDYNGFVQLSIKHHCVQSWY